MQKNTKTSSTQQHKMQNVWYPKIIRHIKEQEKTSQNEEKSKPKTL